MKALFKIDIYRFEDVIILMNLTYSDHDEIRFKSADLIELTKALSNELGINDLLKLRDHVESKIKEIYQVKQDDL